MHYPFATYRQNRIIYLAAFLCLNLLFSVVLLGVAQAESDTEYAQQFRRLGAEAQKNADYGKALFYYSRAAAYLPDDPSIQNDLGLMYEQLGKLGEAEESYRAAIEKDTRYVPAYANLGILLKKLGRYELAAIYLKQRIDMGTATDPWMLSAQEELEDLYRKAPHLKNSRTLESAVELEHEIAQDKTLAKQAHQRKKSVAYDLALQKGLDAFSQKDYEQAILAFEEALTVKPNSAEAKNALRRARTEGRKLEVAGSLDLSSVQNRDVFIDRDLSTLEGNSPEDELSIAPDDNVLEMSAQ